MKVQITGNGALRFHDGTRTIRYRGKRYHIALFTHQAPCAGFPDKWTRFLPLDARTGICFRPINDGAFVIGSYHLTEK